MIGSRIEVPPRLTAPAGSGQGGYSCGLVATLVGNPAEVTLRAPVPLGRPLSVDQLADGGVAVRDGGTLIAEGRRAGAPDLHLPHPPRNDAGGGARGGGGRSPGVRLGGPRLPDLLRERARAPEDAGSARSVDRRAARVD